MKRIIYLSIMLVMTSSSLICKYPVYMIGENFSGIDKSETDKGNKKYIYQGLADSSVFLNNQNKLLTDSENLYERFKLYMMSSPYYIRLEDESGKTLWTSNLSTITPFDEAIEREGSKFTHQKNKEYLVDEFHMSNSGLLLYDDTANQLVLKDFNGEETRFPSVLSDYLSIDDLIPDNWIFIKFGEQKKLDIAMVNHKGELQWHCQTDIYADSFHDIQVNETKDRILIGYFDSSYTIRFLILSTSGEIIRDFPEIIRNNFTDLFINAPDYVVVRQSSSVRLVIDIRSGEIVAEVVCSSIDLTIINNRLLGIVGFGFFAALIDVLTGKLIQDFTDYKHATDKNYEISDVKISQDAKDIWIGKQTADKDIQVRHFQLQK